jgi:anhydro-N-acetylmuramic acid kinase
MNRNLQLLQHIAQKPERRILGLMSGTSLDGLDLALCRISGSGRNTRVAVEQHCTFDYPEEFKNELRSVFAKEEVSLEKLTLLHTQIGIYHGELVLNALATWKVKPEEVDAIASHGQTVYHAPQHFHQQKNYPNATLQIGDADHLAYTTGILTLSDFRQKHTAMGGEGAPLAIYGDYILYSNETENRILLNLGGIANYSFLPQGGDAQKVISTDVGPANTLIDAAVKAYFGLDFDADGAIARKGQKQEALLMELMKHPFLAEALPKSTGPEMFHLAWVKECIEKMVTEIEPEAIVSTLTHFTARVIAQSIRQHFPLENTALYASGGGAHNVFLMEILQQLLPEISCQLLEVLGTPLDAKEAVLFAILANETLVGEALGFEGLPAVSLGKISFPS